MTHYKYKAVKEADGTYSIRCSVFGLNWDVLLLGVRGCNVKRVINALYRKDQDRE